MESFELSFGKLIILQDDLAELIVNWGIDIDTGMIAELHNLLLSHFASSFSLLINRANSYSTQFDALMQFGVLIEINKIAIIAPNRMAKLSAEFMVAIPRSFELNIQVFSNRENALAWL